jgi:hypothetical protein
MSTPIAFIICTEPGRLEGQSLLLAESLRCFGDRLRDAPIYSFHPRLGDPISTKTQNAFEQLGVIHRQLPLNTQFHDFPWANKPLVCAYAEQNIEAEVLVFVDSDQCFFSEPKDLLLPDGVDASVRPEYGKGVGSTGVQDTQDDYWQKLYQVFNVQEEKFVNTAIGNHRIRAYWNSGLIAVRRSAGLFSAWKENFETVMALKLYPSQGIYFSDQVLLSITLCAREAKISEFSSPYSYPIPLHNRLSKEAQVPSFDQIVSMHYFNLFFYQDWKQRLKKLKNLNRSSSRYEWLCDGVVRHSMPYHPVLHRHMLNLRNIENKLRRFKIDINISKLIEQAAQFK